MIFASRAEGPKDNRPGRKAGKNLLLDMSTEGAAQNKITECRAFSAHSLIHLFPGLAAGPTILRPFGPQIKTHDLDKPEGSDKI
jgi:hypothetical protein